MLTIVAAVLGVVALIVMLTVTVLVELSPPQTLNR